MNEYPWPIINSDCLRKFSRVWCLGSLCADCDAGMRDSQELYKSSTPSQKGHLFGSEYNLFQRFKGHGHFFKVKRS